MEEDEANSSAEGEDFSALEVLKQQFMGHAHTVCRPATPVSEKIQAIHRYLILFTLILFYHSPSLISQNILRSASAKI